MILNDYYSLVSASVVISNHTSWSRNMKESVVEAGALVAALSPSSLCLRRAPALLPLMCAARSQLSKDFDEREREGGEERRREGASVLEGKGEREKGPEENPSFSRVLNLPNLTQLPLILQSASFISSPFLSLYLPPLILSLSQILITLCTFLSLSHTSEQPATHSSCN